MLRLTRAQALFSEAAADCSAALAVDAGYVKALLRRARASEALGELEHLETALGDFQRVLQLEPGHAAALAGAARLEPRVAAAREALKEEMLATLKGFGNSLLGRFGLSLDNFKAEKDPATGSYSIAFNGGGGGASAAPEETIPAALGQEEAARLRNLAVDEEE